MHPALSRARLGLYAVAVLALVTAAVIALFSVGSKSASGADAARKPASRTSSTVKHPRTTAPRKAHAITPVSPSTAGTTPTKRTPSHSTQMAGAAHSAHPATKAPKVYTVRPGDTLTAIAAWFHVRGYSPLYAWNKTVIGRNPDLIFPGQKIVVVPGGSVSVTSSH